MKKSQRMTNLKRRYSFISLITICICLSAFSVFQYIYMDDIFIYEKKQDMQQVASEIKNLKLTGEEYLTTLADYESNHNLYIEIYSPRNKLVYTTRSNEAVYDKTDGSVTIELKPRIMRILSHTELDDGSYFEVREEYFASAQYIVYGTFYGEDAGIEIYTAIDVLEENAKTASNSLLALSMIILIAIFIASNYYNSLFTNPIRRITNTAKKMAKLDFSESCPPFRIRELNELSENINILSGRLDKALTELKTENRQLESDIQLERKIEKSRRSFIANMSHELKTPISIIQGYAEGMKYGIGCENKDEYCDIIIEESEKMNNLVVKIMEFMQYGSGAYEADMNCFNISEFLEKCIISNELLISGAKATVEFDCDEKLIGYGDAELLSHVFGNYLSNAVTHLDYERIIRVSVKDTEDSYRVTVFNSGKPIPGSDIANIWQSFYRADKAHSRKEGHFGLGLSIVVSLQEMHNQKYGVENKKNGVEFYFDIKKGSN